MTAALNSRGVRMVDGDARAVIGRRHAGHHDLTAIVVLILEALDRTLAARPPLRSGPDASKNTAGRRPGKDTALQKVLSGVDLIGLVVYVNRRHGLSPRAALLTNVAREVFFEKIERALQRLHGTGRQGRRMYAPWRWCGCEIRRRPRSSGRPQAVLDGVQNSGDPGQGLRGRGVHQPQDSWAKKAHEIMPPGPTGTGSVIEDDHVAGAQSAAGSF